MAPMVHGLLLAFASAASAVGQTFDFGGPWLNPVFWSASIRKCLCLLVGSSACLLACLFVSVCVCVRVCVCVFV